MTFLISGRPSIRTGNNCVSRLVKDVSHTTLNQAAYADDG